MDKEKPEAKTGVEHRRADDFVARYANNVFFEISLWDMKITFGELDQSLGENVVVQHEAITMPWPAAKILSYFLQLNLAAQEARTGRFVLQPGIISLVPDKVPKELANDRKAIKAHTAMRKIQQAFLAENPEAAPEDASGE